MLHIERVRRESSVGARLLNAADVYLCTRDKDRTSECYNVWIDISNYNNSSIS